MKLEQLTEDVTLKCSAGAKLDWNRQDNWQKTARGYSCTLVYQGRRMSTDFWQGTGISEPPTVADVFDCLLSDAATIESSRDFEEWAADMGHDIDSVSDLRRAKKLYNAVSRQTERLKRLLGYDYDTFLYADRK
jgi:hypothetical protein